MIRRFRFLTALLALLTLSAYGAEVAAFSAFCADVGVEQSAAATDGEHGNHAEHGGGDTEPSHQSHCPLGMAGGGMCVAASLPAPASMTVTPFSPSSDAFNAPAAAHDQTRVHSLFRPPRA